MKNGRDRERVVQVFCKSNVPVTLLGRGRFWQQGPDNSQGKVQMPYAMSVLTIFEA